MARALRRNVMDGLRLGNILVVIQSWRVNIYRERIEYIHHEQIFLPCGWSIAHHMIKEQYYPKLNISSTSQIVPYYSWIHEQWETATSLCFSSLLAMY